MTAAAAAAAAMVAATATLNSEAEAVTPTLGIVAKGKEEGLTSDAVETEGESGEVKKRGGESEGSMGLEGEPHEEDAVKARAGSTTQ